MNSSYMGRNRPTATVLVTLIMFIGSIPCLDIAKGISSGDVIDIDTNTFEFDETIYHESIRNAFGSNPTMFTVPAWGAGDGTVCQAIQTFATSTWDCTDLDIKNVAFGGHHLEYDQYSFNLQFVYQYKIEYSGSIDVETTTIWPNFGQPQTTTTVTDSTEKIIVSAKASLRLQIYRTYVGPGMDYPQLRNVIPVDVPVFFPTDIDGDGSGFNVGNTRMYTWDNYVEFATKSNQYDKLGSTHELDGNIPIINIELLEPISKYLSTLPSSTAQSTSKLLKALNYLIDVNFRIDLDLEVDLVNQAQIFLGMSSVSIIRNTYSSQSRASSYGCLLNSGSLQNTCTKLVSGSSTQMNGILGFKHSIQTKESYSANIVIEPTNRFHAKALWALLPGSSPDITIPITRGNYPSTSYGPFVRNQYLPHTMTYETIQIDSSGYGGIPPNIAPTISLQNSEIQNSILYANTGELLQFSVNAYDGDGDSMSGSLSWGDSTYSDWSTSIPNSASHTYTESGFYHVGAEIQDGVSTSHSAPLLIIVTPESNVLESMSIISSDSMADEGETVTFTLNSVNPLESLNFVFDDGLGNVEDIQPTSGSLSSIQRAIQYNVPGDYSPSVMAYDSQSNLLGYETIPLRILPDFGNGSTNSSQFQLIGDGVLIVIDDNGHELSTEERTEEYQNTNSSSGALLQAVAKVATIRNRSMEIHIVGDTDLDGIVDSPGANGPGLNILRHYSTVVWTTGGDQQPLTDFDEAVLRTYVESAGSLILFSQDYLKGAEPGETNWAPGTFAYDILGIGSSSQDIGNPSGDFQITDGGGTKNGAYVPLAGIETIAINSLEDDSYQDHISSERSVQMPCEFQSFESSSLSNSRSTFTDCNTGADLTSTHGQGSVSWTTWSSHWMRDCTYYASGSCSYKSAPASHNSGKQMRAYVPASTVNQQLSFYFMVSTEANYDKLEFIVNGNTVQQWSGSQSWTQYTYTLPASTSQTTLEWWYVKDGSGTSGADTVWIDHFVICCDVGVEERGETYEILSDGVSNFGVVHHAYADADNDGQDDTTTHTAFIAIDPVQFEYKYDLETTLLQLIDWSSNRNPIGSTPGGGIHASERANFLPVGIDMIHPAAHMQGGVQWYNIRLFEGQNIQIDSSIYNRPSWNEASRSNYKIDSLKIFNPDGISTLGSSTTTDDWVLEYTADSTGIHQIRIELNYTGTQETLPSPWYELSVKDSGDTFSPTLVLDGSSIHDALSPQNWTRSAGNDEYSSTWYDLGTLQSGEYYGLTFTSTDFVKSHSIEYVLVDVNLFWQLVNQSENDNDGDGIPNDIDTDDDNDGILDESDPNPYDRDDDGIDDAEDEDDDGNGIEDIDEALFETGDYVLPSGGTHTQLVQVFGTKEIAYVISNVDSYNHPLLGSFGFDIEYWSMPSEDESDLTPGSYQLTENLEESFWVSNLADTSDTFTVDVAWDEGMVVRFHSDSPVIGGIAEVSCGTSPTTIIELGMESDIELDCQETHTTASIVISSNSQLMEYSLLFERKETSVEIIMNQPMFGTNLIQGGSDLWELISITPGQVIDINGDGIGTIEFYNRQGQNLKTESLSQTSRSINIPNAAKRFSVIDAGEYGFVVIEPSLQSTSLSSPDPVLIGEMLTVEMTSSQQHDFSNMLSPERISHMWNLAAPSLEFEVISHQDIAEVNVSSVTYTQLFPLVSTDSVASLSVNSSELGIGEHGFVIAVESSWTGIVYYNVMLIVNDIPNTPPILTGPENFTLTLNETFSWDYLAFDPDGDLLTFSLIDSPTEILLETDSETVIGSIALILTWQPLTEGNYTVTVVVSDGADTTEITLSIDVVPIEVPPAEDIYGCMDSTAVNFDSTATITDSSCEYPDEQNEENEENNNSTGDSSPSGPVDDLENGDDVSDKEMYEDESEQELESNESGSMVIVIGSLIGLIALFAITSVVIIRRKRGDEITFSQELDQFDQWDGPDLLLTSLTPEQNHELPQIRNAANPVVLSEPSGMHVQSTHVSSEPNVPRRVNNYLELAGGGEYSLDERGTIYTDLSGYEWVQLADESFVRLN